MADIWDAGQYLPFGGERSRPLLRSDRPGGRGPSPAWPSKRATRQPDRRARAALAGRDGGRGGQLPGDRRQRDPGPGARAEANLRFELGDVWGWRTRRPVDVLTCNAVLQWVPGHQRLLRDWADLLAPGGWLAFQLPGNFDQPSHVIIRELAQSPRWRDPAGGRRARPAGGGTRPTTWNCSPGPGTRWTPGRPAICTGCRGPTRCSSGPRAATLRQVLAALDSEQAAAFTGEYAERLRQVYRPRSFGTIFPFRRVFTVVHRLTA